MLFRPVGQHSAVSGALTPQEEAELLSLLHAEDNVQPLREYISEATPRYPAPAHVQAIIDAFERTRHGPVRITISMPPRHAKTETGMNGLAWRLKEDPATLNAFCSYSADLAKSKSRQIRKRFKLGGGEMDRSSRSVADWTTTHGGGLVAAGVGGPLTGKGITGIGYIDDPIKNREEAESKLQRDKLWDWYTSTFHTRIEPGASIIVVATRWHEDDLIGRLHSDEYEHEEFEAINLPAVMDAEGIAADERILGADGFRVPGKFRKDVKPLWPGYWPLSELEKKRVGAGEYDWWAMYQGQPSPKGSRIFRNDPARFNLEAFKRDVLSQGGFRMVIAVDPAATASTRADYSVAAVGCARGWAEEMELFWVHVMRGQWTIPHLCRELYGLQQLWRVPLAVEAVGAFRSVPDILHETDPNLVLLPVELRGDKFSRSQPYATAWNDGRVYTPYDAAWATPWIAEHAAFTGINDKNDDQVDAGAHGFTALLRAAPERELVTSYVGPYG